MITITITLLVPQLSVPGSTFDSLWRGIGEEWHSYLAYATSSLTIGGFWCHRAIRDHLGEAVSALREEATASVVSELPARTS